MENVLFLLYMTHTTSTIIFTMQGDDYESKTCPYLL